ncbi:hypothetical protein GQ53DRAFT_747840, partial [Thozetella sp. PMI_491]
MDTERDPGREAFAPEQGRGASRQLSRIVTQGIGGAPVQPVRAGINTNYSHSRPASELRGRTRLEGFESAPTWPACSKTKVWREPNDELLHTEVGKARLGADDGPRRCDGMLFVVENLDGPPPSLQTRVLSTHTCDMGDSRTTILCCKLLAKDWL